MTASFFRLGTGLCQLYKNTRPKTKGRLSADGRIVASTSLSRLGGAVRQLHKGPGPRAKINRALLIDGENVAPKHMKSIVGKLKAAEGYLRARKCFVSFEHIPNLNAWKEVAEELCIELVDTPRVAKGKSSTDMRMCIDAIDLCYRSNPYLDEFAIVSSDCDFLPVVQYLRSVKRNVVGFGKQGCKQKYSNAFNQFVTLENLELEESIRELLVVPFKTFREEFDGSSSTTFLTFLGKQLRKIDPSFTPQQYGFKKISELAKASGYNLEGELCPMDTKVLLATAVGRYKEPVGGPSSVHFLSALGKEVRNIDPSFTPHKHGFTKLSEMAEACGYNLKGEIPRMNAEALVAKAVERYRFKFGESTSVHLHSELGREMRTIDPIFTPQKYGFKNVSELAEAFGYESENVEPPLDLEPLLEKAAKRYREEFKGLSNIAFLTFLGKEMRNVDPSFTPGKYGFKNVNGLAEALGYDSEGNLDPNELKLQVEKSSRRILQLL